MSHIDKIVNTSFSKIPIGISSCLLGEKVRFDGGHKNSAYITKTLSDYFDFHPFCPEVSIGLGIPRETIRLVTLEPDGPIHCVGTKNTELDVTQKLKACANQQFHWLENLSGYIFKKDSPSCGMERVKVYYKTNPQRNGIGIYANEILKQFPYLPTEEEGRLGDAKLRENFILRVFIYHRWRALVSKTARGEEVHFKDYIDFHAQHKLIYMAHNQEKTAELGQLTANISNTPLPEYQEKYLAALTQILAKPATPKSHVNVLKHIQGYLKRELCSDDKTELSETIEQYRQGYLPLIVPITLLRHHFRKCPTPYIDQSYYMQPHPMELMLRNNL